MFQQFRLKIDKQLLLFSAFVLLSVLSSLIFSFRPIIRPGFATFFRGLIAATGLVMIHLLGAIVREWCRRRWKFKVVPESVPEKGADKLGAAILAGGGEEVLLRGFIFAPLLAKLSFGGSTFLISLLNAALSGLLHSRRGAIAYERVIEGALMGLLYQQYRSIFILFIARTGSELFWFFLGGRLKQKALSEIWRKA